MNAPATTASRNMSAQSLDLGVRAAVVAMPAAPDDAVIAERQSAHARIRFDLAATAKRQLHGLAHQGFRRRTHADAPTPWRDTCSPTSECADARVMRMAS